MTQSQVFVSFFLDASRPKSNGKCLVKLNIYQKPKKQRYATIFHVTKDEWSKLNQPNLRDKNLRELKKKLQVFKTEVEAAIEKVVPFSFTKFEENFLNTKQDIKTSVKLEDWFANTVRRLREKDQVGTASSYQTTINSINQFKANLQIFDITPNFLQSYEKYLLKEHKSHSTVGIYMRNLRAVINETIAANALARDKYPFKEYEIPAGRNVKKSLKEFDIRQLLNHKPIKEDQKKAFAYWIFSYLCNGINFTDILLLKPENISGDYLTFYRQKTIRTKKKDLRPIRVALNARAIEIIEKYKNRNIGNSFLFPILEPGLSAITIKHRCQRFIKWVNWRMSEICEELNIDNKATTYSARHTFSTVMKRKGAPTSYIKDALGHSSVTTTENYLDSFEDPTLVEYANKLTEFS